MHPNRRGSNVDPRKIPSGNVKIECGHKPPKNGLNQRNVA
jgi:hypothetical protein